MAKLILEPEGRASFRCPGCGMVHTIVVSGPTAWQWNGSVESPTLYPSVLARSGHFAPGRQSDRCWCDYNRDHPNDPAPFKCGVCHSFVTDGRIQFLNDCTHALKGQTVPLPEYE